MMASEARRQQALLAALLASPAALPEGAAALGDADPVAGLRAYRANAQAIAERALTAAYPVIARLLGAETMSALARDLWREHPPLRGDLAWFGGELADWLTGVAELSDVPFLPDVARLEWALHSASGAPDEDGARLDLQRLASESPEQLRVVFVPGSFGLASAWPVLTLWQAHQVVAEQPPDLRDACAALTEKRAEAAWVWRCGLQVEVARLSTAEHAFNVDLLAGTPLGHALSNALARETDFSFEHWLTRALREGWLAEFQSLT